MIARIAARLGVDRASALILGASLSLATMAAMVHALGSRCDWVVVSLVRAVVMFVSAATIAKASGLELAIWRPRTLWVRSLAGSCSLVCNFYALSRMRHVADAVTLMNLQPLWIVVISAAFLRRWPKWGEALGVASGIAGVYLIGGRQVPEDRVATVVALLSSISSAVAMLGLHRLRSLDPRAVVAHFAGVASLVSAAWLVLQGGPSSSTILDPRALILLAGIGALGTLGQVLLTKAYAAGPPAKVAVVGLTQVVFAMAFEVAIWGLVLTPTTLAGFALVLAPTTWLSIRAASRAGPSREGS